MKYRLLGRTGLEVSAIGLGTWAFNAQVYGHLGEGEALQTVRTALEEGITFFDTAPLYGNRERDGIAEQVLGKGLGKRRQEVCLSTKFGRRSSAGNRPEFNGAAATASVEASLKRLGTDRIDVLFFHSPFGSSEIEDDVWEALHGLKEAGKVRFVGHSISKFQETEGMARQWAGERKIDVVQVVYSLLNRESERLIADLGKAGVGVVARESLANGFLSGLVRRDAVFPPGSLNARYDREEIEARVEQVERLSFLVRGPVQSMAQAALRWVLDNQGVSVVLTGARSAAEVGDGARAGHIDGYSEAELQRARALHTRDFQAA